MLIHLPDVDEPFCVTDHYCGDHRINLSPEHFEIIKHGHYKTFVLLTPDQMDTLRMNLKDLYGHQTILYYECWRNWLAETFNGSVMQANVTIAEYQARYNGNYLYCFEDPDDALMFKLKWI